MDHRTKSALTNNLDNTQPDVQQSEQLKDQRIGSHAGHIQNSETIPSSVQISVQDPTRYGGISKRKQVRSHQVRMACLLAEQERKKIRILLTR
jgi:hypothetical protein